MTLYRKNNIVGCDSILSTLKRVEINPTELCNRFCVFCPRHDPTIYENKNIHMKISTVSEIAQQLKEINFKGIVGFVGFGEPLLYKYLLEAIEILSTTVNTRIEINTNGDHLSLDLVKNLEKAGLTDVLVSMYDNNKEEYFQSMFENSKIKLTVRHHYDSINSYNLFLVNRSDIIKNEKQLNISRSCYLPFYKLFIDHTGDYLLCSEDWGRDSKTEKFNVYKTKIKDYWITLHEHRKMLLNGQRSIKPCNKCNVNGKLDGQDSFIKWLEHDQHR